MSIKFYLDNKKREHSAIAAVVFIKGSRYKIATGLSVVVNKWKTNSMRAAISKDYQDGHHINDMLEIWKGAISNVKKLVIRNFVNLKQEDFTKLVREEIEKLKMKSDEDIFQHAAIIEQSTNTEQKGGKGLVEFATNFKNTVARSKATLKRYQTTIRVLSEYEKSHGKLTFDDVGIEFYNKFIRWMEDGNYSVNYIGDMIKNIKVFMNEAAERGMHNNLNYLSRRFKVIDEESDSIYLTEGELQKLFDLEINGEMVKAKIKGVNAGNMNKRVKSLIDCRDRFLIGAYTALRFSDYNKLDRIKPEEDFITNRNEKTGTRVTIPMHHVIKEIARRRNGELPYPVSNQKMNDALKLLGEIAGLDDEVEVTMTKGGRRVTEKFKKYELITTHTARRSACTNMYLAGIPVRVIMAFSGHKTEKSFLKYIKVKQFEDAIRMKDHPFFNKS